MNELRHAFGQSFQVPRGYLDTPTAGIPPVVTSNVLRDAVAAWSTGRLAAWHIDAATETARAAFGRLIGVAPELVATGPSVSVMIGMLAAQVPDGTRVLTVAGEYSSVTLPFAAQGGRGVTVDSVPTDELARLAPDYDLIAFSLVQSRDGAVLDAEPIRAATRSTATQVLVDVTQCVGWLPLDLGWADYVVGAGYKFLLGPRGIAWLALRHDRIAQLAPAFANWRATDDLDIYGAELQPAAGARRFDTSPIWASLLAAAQSLYWIEQLDMRAVRDHVVGLADFARGELGIPAQPSPIVSIPCDLDRDELAQLGITASVRAGHVRVGFHVYNDLADATACVEAIRETTTLSRA